MQLRLGEQADQQGAGVRRSLKFPLQPTASTEFLCPATDAPWGTRLACWWMMISSEGEAMKAETAPATPALPKRSKLVSAASDFFSTTVCIRRFVPNCEAVIGAMLTMFIYVEGQLGEGGDPQTPAAVHL